MKKLLLSLFVIAITQTITKAQCPPGAFAYQSLYPQCASGCGVLLLGWPEGVLVNIYGGTPLNIITSTTISGTLGGSGTGDAFTCVPCNTPLVYASATPGASSGCVIATIGIVPVKLTSFSATTISNNKCLLKWDAVSETGAVKYTIQKSADGINFSDVAIIKGTQQAQNSYSFQDASITKNTIFYRIKIAELSGNIIYSKTVLVKNENNLGFSIYPNPAAAEFKIALPARLLPASVAIINAQGVVIDQETINQSTYTINKYLAKGIYAVKVTGVNNESVTQRLVRN